MLKPLLTAAMLAFCTAANATVWHCTNQIEVGCSETACNALLLKGEFTPMSVNFTDDGFVYACMYSGCWEGRGRVVRGKRFLTIHAHGLIYSTDPNPGEMREDIAVLVDFEDNVALMKAGGYAQPLTCTTSE